MSKGRDGKAGRLGDETRARINDLKGGWKLPGAPADEEAMPTTEAPSLGPPEEEPRAPSRVKKPTRPPPAPPPATAQKAVLSAQAPASTADAVPAPPASSLPSLPKARTKKPTMPPPPPGGASSAGHRKVDADSRTSARPSKPPPSAPRSGRDSVPPPAPPARAAKRPSLPPAPIVSAVGADDDAPTSLSSMDEPFGMPPAPALGASGKATGTVRLPDSLPREKGFFGDISYLFRVMAKRRSARIEMENIKAKIADEKEARNTKLLEYGRHAVGDDSYDQTMVGRARAALLAIEEKRSLHAGRIASANEKMEALERQRREVKANRDAEIAKLEMEIKAVKTSLAPLTERASAARKKTTRLRLQLQSLDEQILKKEASLVAVQGGADKASVHAEMASLRAEREAVAQDEPAIAAEIDDLEPKIASLTSSKSELADKIAELRAEEELDVIRAAEKADAVKASRVVEERAVSDQESKQQRQLIELGEGLHHNPPNGGDPKANAIMRHDLEIGTLERRSLEISELLESVEKAAMVRGAIYLGLLVLIPLAAAGYFVFLR